MSDITKDKRLNIKDEELLKDPLVLELSDRVLNDYNFDLVTSSDDTVNFYRYSTWGTTYRISYSAAARTICRADINFHLSQQAEVINREDFANPGEMFSASYAEVLYILRDLYLDFLKSASIKLHLHLSPEGMSDEEFLRTAIDIVPIEELENIDDDIAATAPPSNNKKEKGNEDKKAHPKDDNFNDSGTPAAA